MPDLRDAWRALRRTPLVTAVAILSLALGIGANTAMFSIVDALILRSLPVPHAGRLAIVSHGQDFSSLTNPIWEALRERASLFNGAFAWGSARFNLARGGEVNPVDGLYVSGAMFDLLGVSAQLGRTILPTDDQRGGGSEGLVAVISDAYWRRRYGASPDVIGQGIALGQTAFTIVGVTPPSFFGPEVGRSFDVAVPLGAEAAVRGAESSLDRRSTWWLHVMVRLRPTQTLAQATAALRAVQPQVREATMPENYRQESRDQYLTDPLQLHPAASGTSSLRREYRRPLLTLMAVAGLVLLIACGNIANLLLARATARRHELSVRQALGASRWRLARQLLAESVLLSVVGAAVGILFAVWGSRLLVAHLSTPSEPVVLALALDWRMFGFTALVAVTTALLFGTLPALRASRVRPMEAMREQGRGNSSDGRIGLGGGLVVAQVALSLALVVGAGLFVRTFAALSSVQLGFDRDRILVVNLSVQRNATDSLRRADLFERVRQAARATPGVSQAAISVVTPVSGSTWNDAVWVDGAPQLPEEQRLTNINLLSPDWFATYGTRLVAGRDLDESDRAGAPLVAVVNQTFATHFFGAQNPIGQMVRRQGNAKDPDRVYQVVGLAEDAVYASLRDTVPPTMYLALAQNMEGPTFAALSVRSEQLQPAALSRPLVEAISRVDPGLSLTVRTLASQVETSLSQERLVALLSGFFGGLALLLAGLGLYGVTAYSVSRRRAELGIRMALGSAPAGVLRLVLQRVAALVAMGVAAGAALTWGLSRLVASLLYGLSPQDPLTFAGGATLLVAVGIAAGWIPAQRASRIDPATVLREE
jgi:predicted permease